MAKDKKKSSHKSGEMIELEEMNIFLRIPKEAVRLEITAQVINENGELMKVSTKLSVSDIRDRRQEFLDNVEDGDDYDARFVLTDEGREYLRGLAASLTDPGELP